MIVVLLPAYNEEKSLLTLMPKIQQTLGGIDEEYRIIVCDDGSNDRTAELAEQMAKKNPHIRVFHNSKNMGIGYTYRKGIRLAKKKYCMWVPGDNEVTGDGISNMLKHIGEADLVISYIQNVGIRPWYRQIVSGSFTNLMRILFNIKLNHFLGMVLCKTELIKKLINLI